MIKLLDVKESNNHTTYKILGIKFKRKNRYYIKNLEQFAKIIEADLPKGIDSTIPFKRVIIQSYHVKPGDFVIDSGIYSSTKTIKESIEKGATAIFCSYEIKKNFPQKQVIPVKNTLEAMYKFEIWRTRHCKAKRICITGSIGKTTATGLINSVVANSFHTFSHKGNFNSAGSILQHTQMLTSKHKYWVQEVGGYEPKTVEEPARFLQPDIVVLTNILDAHLEHYKTRENIFYDKASLERYAKKDAKVIINYDDDILRNGQYSHKVITCSIKDPNADYYAKDIKTDNSGLHFTIVCNKKEEIKVHLNLYGDYNAYNALFATAIGKLIGIKLKKIPDLLKTYYPSGMRQNHLLIGGYSIYADCFNAVPESMLSAAQILEKFSVSDGGRKIFVSGQMNELGKQSAQKHREVGCQLANIDIDTILTFGAQAKYTYEGLKESGFKNAMYFETRQELDEWIKNNLKREDEIFFKSSHGDICLAITIDNVFGTTLTNKMEWNAGRIVEEGNYKFKIRNYDVAEIIEYTGKEKDVVIPAQYGDNKFTRIAHNAFKNKNIENIVIPDTIKTICHGAFHKCRMLKSVKLPQHLLYIDRNAFNSCTSLREIEIPSGVIHIEKGAFYDCKSLKKAIIYEKVGFIGEEAFKNVSDEFEIVCKKGAYAEQYAKDNGIKVSYIV